jgi:hypothetical protein
MHLTCVRVHPKLDGTRMELNGTSSVQRRPRGRCCCPEENGGGKRMRLLCAAADCVNDVKAEGRRSNNNPCMRRFRINKWVEHSQQSASPPRFGPNWRTLKVARASKFEFDVVHEVTEWTFPIFVYRSSVLTGTNLLHFCYPSTDTVLGTAMHII